MADYKDKIDEWQKTVRRKARELDEKFALSDLVDEGSRAAGDAAKRGAETIASGAEKLRVRAERLAGEGDLGNTARRAADEAVRGAEKAGKIIQDAVATLANRRARRLVKYLTMPRLITTARRIFTIRVRRLRELPARQPREF